jgi:hypothetical protein
MAIEKKDDFKPSLRKSVQFSDVGRRTMAAPGSIYGSESQANPFEMAQDVR